MLISLKAGEAKTHVFTDMPSVTLLKVMAQYDYQAPDNWQGCRALTSK
jgi:hypothetical protein